MSVYLKTEGFVLKKKQLFHKDTLITFFTKDKGKITAVAKGIKSPSSKRVSSLMTGNLLKLVFYSKNERYYLQTAETVSIFIKIKEKEIKQKQLYFYLFILDRLLPEQQKEEGVYGKIKEILIRLSHNEFSYSQTMDHTNTLLSLFGYHVNSSSWGEFVTHIENVLGKKLPAFII